MSCSDVEKQHSEESQQDSSRSREMVSGGEGGGLGPRREFWQALWQAKP